jgi:hypothetical protein
VKQQVAAAIQSQCLLAELRVENFKIKKFKK